MLTGEILVFLPKIQKYRNNFYENQLKKITLVVSGKES